MLGIRQKDEVSGIGFSGFFAYTTPVMVTISSSPKAACVVDGTGVSIDVFPATPAAGRWSLLSHPQEETTDPKIISWPGEYDFNAVTLKAVGQEGGKEVSYTSAIDMIRIAFVDGPVVDWSDTDIEQLGDIDVLVVAADNQKKVQALVESVDPRIVVLFKIKDGDMAGVAKALGVKDMQPVEELKLKPGSLPTDARQVVILK